MVKKLLIITQKVNKTDPILGFFHRWIIEFAKHYELITVICLEKGEYSLPANVKVLSLGKEQKKSKFQYLVNFYKYIWQERGNYEAVFVHMNQEYILLGGLFWLFTGKKVYMWRNHHAGSLLTDLAAFLCTKVFCTSKFSYTAKYRKTTLMPVGIDTDLFRERKEITRIPNSILFLGRIAPIKRPDLLIQALIELKALGYNYSATVVGDSLAKDRDYHESLKKKVRDNNLESVIKFQNGVPNEETVDIYNKHEIFVNLSTSGMYDKTIFEAMACGCFVLVSNRNLDNLIDSKFLFTEGNKDKLVEKLKYLILHAKQIENIEMIRFVLNNHSLHGLLLKINSVLLI